MTIDLALWYARARETSFERANRLADEAKAQTTARLGSLVMDHVREPTRDVPGLSYSDALDRAREPRFTVSRSKEIVLVWAWWKDAGYWQEPGRHHSPTEQLCMESLLAQCPNRRRTVLEVAVGMVRDVMHEVGWVQLELLPLRDIMAARGETVITLELGRGQTMRQTVPLRRAG